MKILIAYSSQTGNTRKLAEAVHITVPGAELSPVELAPNPERYDLVYVGFWVEAENANAAAREFMKKLGNQKIALFATLGAYPDSQHAVESMTAAAEAAPYSTVIDTFICQGEIDRQMIEWMEKLPKNHGNAPTDSRRKLWKDSEGHPDETDLKNVSDWAMAVLEKAK